MGQSFQISRPDQPLRRTAARRPYPGETMRTLLDDLDAFLQEHRRGGALDARVADGRVWMTCECGAGLSRRTELLPTRP
jgi:hypothetical protein